MAVQLNSEALRPVFDWFASGLVIFNEQAQLSPQVSIKMLKEPEGRKQICDFLSAADISIADIKVVMSISSIMSSGLQNMQASINRTAIAGSSLNVESDDFREKMVGMHQGEIDVKAAAKVIKAADQILGTIIASEANFAGYWQMVAGRFFERRVCLRTSNEKSQRPPASIYSMDAGYAGLKLLGLAR